MIGAGVFGYRMTRNKTTNRNEGPRISLRLDLAPAIRIGPGKVALLEEIAHTGSISAAGRTLKMSYRRAWKLIEDMQTSLGTRVVSTEIGGSGGGGARLTEMGTAIVTHYRRLEQQTAELAADHLSALNDLRHHEV